MNLSVGIVGLPNVGKSTLFNSLLKKQQALVANYPFATIEPNVGIVPVPDMRLEKLAAIYQAPVVPATCKFVDIAGLVKGANQGEGLGNRFLAHIREASLIVHVVRAFSDANVVQTGTGPLDDWQTVMTELELADLEHPDAPPLTKKPQLAVINVSESQLNKASSLEKNWAAKLNFNPEAVIAICAKTEAELAGLEPADQKEYLQTLGLSQSGLDRLIQTAFARLGLITFLTAGVKEVRAWTVAKNTPAREAAGAIHTDFVKKFIAADVAEFADFIGAGGWKGAREQGKVRLEGRDYPVQDGDVIEFKTGS